MRKIASLILALWCVAATVFAAPFGWVVYQYDLTATSYTYCSTTAPAVAPTCGTSANDGWIYMPDSRAAVASVEWITKNATSLEYSIECRPSTNTAAQALLVDGLQAVGTENLVILSNAIAFDQCRIGLKLTTDTGANSVTALFATRS